MLCTEGLPCQPTLRNSLQQHPTDFRADVIYIKIGDIYMLMDDAQSAIEHYKLAKTCVGSASLRAWCS